MGCRERLWKQTAQSAPTLIANAECGIRNGAAVPYTAARRETLLSGRVRRSYRSAINTAQLPRPFWFMAGAGRMRNAEFRNGTAMPYTAVHR